jgi:hypothetical protein
MTRVRAENAVLRMPPRPVGDPAMARPLVKASQCGRSARMASRDRVLPAVSNA